MPLVFSLKDRWAFLKENARLFRVATFFEVVLCPFVVTRLVWLLIGWFSFYFVPHPSFDKYIEQGWFLSPHFLIDMWCRWDAKWYLSIIEGGYSAPSDLAKYLSNVAFYPFYPYLIKGIAWLLPNAWVSRSVYLLIGLLISNFSFLAGGWLFYLLVEQVKKDEALARRSLEFLFVFPTAFFFSCFYTESLFLLLSVAVVLAGLRAKWVIACGLAAMATVTRPQGILIVVPLLWIYFAGRAWRFRQIRLDLAWVLLVPLSAVLHFLGLYKISGSYWAPVMAQKAWERGGGLWANLQEVFSTPVADVYKMDVFLWVLFALLLLWGFRRISAGGMHMYALLMLIAPVATGTFFSASRFLVVVFPIFILLAERLERGFWRWLVLAAFFALQTLYFLGWVNYYWIA
ncbi:MAG: hypothetical protein HPY45_08035 [Anaerolineae bacterium]|nr:hypothetical protein [Anaerolineae bacterium]